jgi:hypothetical protein
MSIVVLVYYAEAHEYSLVVMRSQESLSSRLPSCPRLPGKTSEELAVECVKTQLVGVEPLEVLFKLTTPDHE